MQRPIIYNNDKIFLSCMNSIIGQKCLTLKIRPTKSVKYSQTQCVSSLTNIKLYHFNNLS